MVRLVPMVDAVKQANVNGRSYERLVSRRNEAQRAAEVAQADLDRTYARGFDEYLSPFSEVFSTIKNVELGQLPTMSVVPELASIDVELRKVGVKAVQGLTTLAGGGATGAAASALTLTAVGTFAASSTGAAISGLSGAAATSATLAWLGGGSLAAGGTGVAGGTLVLSGLVTAPLLLAIGGFLYIKGKKEYHKQVEVTLELDRAKTQLDVELAKVTTARRRVTDTARLVRVLISLGTPRLRELRKLVGGNDDYSTYTPTERGSVAELAGLATTIAAVMSCPIIDENGVVTQLLNETVATARLLAFRLAA